MPVTLYKRQKQMVDFISQYIQSNGHSPTLQEIADSMSLSSLATVHEHIATLVRKGVLKKYEGAVRGLEITDPRYGSDSAGLTLPILGYIAAGKPIEAIRTNEAIEIPRDMMGPNVFALKVRGDSMIGDGILDGDYVVIEKTNHPKNGDIVVAQVDGEWTMKYYQKKGRQVVLRAANCKYAPITPAEELIVGGVITACVRKYVK